MNRFPIAWATALELATGDHEAGQDLLVPWIPGWSC